MIHNNGSEHISPTSMVSFLEISFRCFLPIIYPGTLPLPGPHLFMPESLTQSCNRTLGLKLVLHLSLLLSVSCTCCQAHPSLSLSSVTKTLFCSYTAAQVPMALSAIPLRPHLSRLLIGLILLLSDPQNPHSSLLEGVSSLLLYSGSLAR